MVALKSKKNNRYMRKIFEGGMTGLLLACALVSVLVLLMVFMFLLGNSLPFLQNNDIWQFLTGTHWLPFGDFPSYGILPLFVGTLMVTLVASLIAIPVGLGATIYLSEIASPQVRNVLKPVIEILAGIPSVIYGLFAALVLSDWIMVIFEPNTRLNALNGALILAVMMIPIMVSVAEEALNSVPRNLREASLALGATRWETLKMTIVPAALPGIVAAIILSMGRAVGETMAVIMATGNSTQFTFNILASMRPLTAALAIDVPEATVGSMAYYSLFAVGLVLFIITFALNLVAEYVLARFKEAYH
ncbi:MAG: phosphate transporter permease subunit PstC [Methanomassiliicoccales archaeon PtaU1.Bin124]|nr:MAG: phosphate transporter permease subunit PstC [Methanomassiliicoccales archaeon PtaU1.Bin124]